MVGEDEYVPPLILYSTVKPAIAVTVGKLNAALHAFVGAVMIGALGKITTLTILLDAHVPVPGVFAGVVPHADVSTNLATIVWQPAAVGIVGVAE